MSVANSRKKNIVKNKKDIPYRKFANENEKYLYGNYLVTLRKFKRTINYSKLLKNITKNQHRKSKSSYFIGYKSKIKGNKINQCCKQKQ